MTATQRKKAKKKQKKEEQKVSAPPVVAPQTSAPEPVVKASAANPSSYSRGSAGVENDMPFETVTQ